MLDENGRIPRVNLMARISRARVREGRGAGGAS